ncbi:MAG TPA: Yip1 family protein [Thermoanaerobaculia bacterium]|nr:Yip1 family protein [Thermoanaerobaculia bacterium]
MTTGIVEPTSAPPVAAQPKNVFARMIGVLFAPEETFRDIVRRPDITAPLLILLVIGYISTFVVMPIMDWDAMVAAQSEQMHKQNPNMSDADIERASGMVKKIGGFMGYVGPIFGAVWWVIVAGVLFLGFRLFGGEGTFAQAFSVTLYSWIPLTIFSIIMTIVARAKGAFDPTTAATIVKSNPAFLVDMKEKPVLFALLGAFDIFTLWTIVLLVIGFAVMSRFSKAKSAAIVVSLWLIALVIKIGFAAMSAMKMKG